MSCDKMPASFMQMLAACLLKNEAGDVLGINAQVLKGAQPCLGVPLIDCETNLSDLESLVVANAFTVDDCGNTALKLYKNDEV